jgi:hypothetical protein
MIHTADFKHNDNGNFHIIQGIRAKVAHFEDKLPKLKEITVVLELALWKLKMNEYKINTDDSSIRRQCHVPFGADAVIRHVLPFLIPT